MTPEEFTTKLQEFRTALTEQATEMEEDPKWVSGDERVERSWWFRSRRLSRSWRRSRTMPMAAMMNRCAPRHPPL